MSDRTKKIIAVIVVLILEAIILTNCPLLVTP